MPGVRYVDSNVLDYFQPLSRSETCTVSKRWMKCPEVIDALFAMRDLTTTVRHPGRDCKHFDKLFVMHDT